MLYVVDLLNVVVTSKGLIPPTIVCGGVTDVSPYLDYHFWQEVSIEDMKMRSILSIGVDPPTNRVTS